MTPASPSPSPTDVQAGHGNPRFFARNGESETDVGARASGTVAGPAAPRSRSPHLRSVAGPAVERQLIPACPSNHPGPDAASDGTLCAAATEYCATVGKDGISFWVFTRPVGQQAGWQLSGQQCLGPQEAGAVAAQQPVVTAADLRRLPLPAGVVHIQPGNGRTLVNVPTNVYLDATIRIIPTVVLGRAVRVRATPLEYRWSFGDGGALRTTDHGAPYPDLRTTHTYTTVGVMSVGLTTIYRGEYSVEGGPWLAVDGTAEVATPPVGVTVVAARSELVDGTLSGGG